MEKKLRIGVPAEYLAQSNPRGACRAGRAIAEELVKLDEFEFLALHSRVPNQLSPVYQAEPLSQWLAEHSMYSGTPGVSTLHRALGVGKNLAKGYASSKFPKAYRELGKVANTVLQVKNQLRPRTGLAGPAPEVARPLYTDATAFDAILSFWWFPYASFNLVPFDASCTKLVGWYLDSTPLKVMPDATDAYMEAIGLLSARSRHILCISRSAERDLNDLFPGTQGKSSVIQLGHRVPEVTGEQTQSTFSRFGVDPSIPCLVAIGVRETSKNVRNFLKAAIQLKKERPELSFQLVLVGLVGNISAGVAYGNLLEEARSLFPVTPVDYISDEDVSALLGGSAALVYPSLWEGFGLPPLEAMSSETLVVTAEYGAPAEVCGEHAIFCDPWNRTSIARALEAVLSMAPEERARRLQPAKIHAAAFTWTRTAEQVASVLRNVCSG